jgi:hypothetical protein
MNNNNNNNNYMNNNMNNMNNNNNNPNEGGYSMNTLSGQLINKGNNGNNGQYKCEKCSSSHLGLYSIKNICPNCFYFEIIKQTKKAYIEYLKNYCKYENANTITKDDFEQYFIKKIISDFNNKPFTLYQAINELNYPPNNNFNFENKKEEIISIIKQQICLYCYCDLPNTEFRLPCGCSFCSQNHLNSFIKEKVQNRISINFKCFCSYEYKPNKLLELFTFLKNKNVFEYNYLIQRLNELFGEICFKCGCQKGDMSPVDIEGFIPLKFDHFICEECIQNESSNYTECYICKIQHKYLLKDF